MQNCRIFLFPSSSLYSFLSTFYFPGKWKGGGGASPLCVWMIKRNSSSSATTTIVVNYIVETLSLPTCRNLISGSQQQQHSRSSITKRHSCSSTWILKGVTPGTDDDTNRIKIGGTYYIGYTQRGKREKKRKIIKKKDKSKNPISWHPVASRGILNSAGCAGWRWPSDDCVCVVL